MILYIYGLVDPRNDQLRYVGITGNLKDRLKGHYLDKRNHHKRNWLYQLKSLGLKPDMFVIEESDDDNWKEAEHFYIEYFRYIGANLLNLTSGGDGARNLAPESLRKLKIANVGRKRTPESRAKQSDSLRGKPRPRALIEAMLNGVRGKPKSDEHRAKLSAALMGVPFTEERKLKLRGRKKSQNAIEKTRKAISGENHYLYGKHHTKESKEKMSATKIELGLYVGEKNPFYGKKHTLESRAKISLKRRGIELTPQSIAEQIAIIEQKLGLS